MSSIGRLEWWRWRLVGRSFVAAIRKGGKMTKRVMPDEELRKLFHSLDRDSGGTISIDELASFVWPPKEIVPEGNPPVPVHQLRPHHAPHRNPAHHSRTDTMASRSRYKTPADNGSLSAKLG